MEPDTMWNALQATFCSFRSPLQPEKALGRLYYASVVDPTATYSRTWLQVSPVSSFGLIRDDNNKARGQSFGGKMKIHLREDCYTHSQQLVALFRATHCSDLVVLIEKKN